MNPKLLYRLTLPALLAAGMMVGSPRAGGAEVSETLVRITAWEDRREATPELVALLRDGDPAIRGRAALALGRIGRAADVSALQPLLADKSAEVRRWAAFALGEIEDSTAASPLEALLLGGEEKDAEVRAIAVEGLGKLRRGAPACRAALDDRSSEVVSRALLAAWQIPVPGAIERVLEVSERGEPELRWTSVYCLMRFLGAPASGRTPIPGGLELTDAERDRVEARLRRSIADPDPRVRMNAARGLRADHDTLTTRGLALLARDADWRVRVEALRALPATGPDGRGRTIDPAALQPFLSDLHPNVRVVAVEALATVPDRAAALPLIQTALSDPRPRVRQVAFGSLLTRLRADGIPAAGTNVELLNEGVRAMQNSKDWSLRALTADAIDLMTHDRARQVLETMLKDEPRVAKQAIEPYLLLRAGRRRAARPARTGVLEAGRLSRSGHALDRGRSALHSHGRHHRGRHRR
ncbi:MAG: HEAT repeat domain-containing protein [Candidatus Eisenbacteria bacterium]|nr:HEAT repeat domain-containing protein [Candidatus Eisenbacteria bacterium]